GCPGTTCLTDMFPRFPYQPRRQTMSFKSVTVAIGLCLFAVGASAQQTILKVSHFLPPASNFQKGVLEPWCKQLAQESGDRLKCHIYPAMQLGGTPAQLINHARDGVADIVW